jgi:hypothetical protein
MQKKEESARESYQQTEEIDVDVIVAAKQIQILIC